MSGFFVPHDLKAPLKGAANGPLAGLSAVVKDMYAIAGERTGGGNPGWLANATPATAHCPVVEKLLAAGATITGKTICDEFFYSVAGMNAHYGTPTNIRAPGCIPGGSSSGSAAAAAAASAISRSAPTPRLGAHPGFALRHLRHPHHACRIDTKGVMDMSPSFDTVGWLAATAGVFRKVGPVLLGGAGVPAPIQRLLIADDCFAEADAPVVAVLNEALAAMQNALPTPQHVRIAPAGSTSGATRCASSRPMRSGRCMAASSKRKNRASAGVAERMTAASRITTAEADAARDVHNIAREEIRAQIAPGTVVALPSAPCIAPRSTRRRRSSIPTAPRHAAHLHRRLGGLPQVSIPVGTVAGCPVGLSFIGWAGGDEALLDLTVDVAKFCGLERP